MTQSSPSQVGPQRLLVIMLEVTSSSSSFSMSSTSASTVAWSCRRQLKEPYTPSLRKNIVSSFLPGCSSSRGCEYICKSDAESPTDDVDGESVYLLACTLQCTMQCTTIIDQGQCHQSIFKHAFAAMLLKLDVSKVVLTMPRGFKVAE